MVQLYYHSLVWILLALLLSRLEQVDGFKISKRNTISYSATYSSSLGNSKNIDFDFDGLQTYARICGLELKKNSNPLFLKLEAYPIGEDKPVGYLTSFIRPFPFQLLQLETIQVKNRRQYLGYKRKSWTIDGPGISFIMGSWALKWAYEKGCKKAQLLAVNDSDKMHMILIRLYQSFGFKILRAIDDETGSVADRITWGAVGTLMELDMVEFFNNWKPKFQELIDIAEKKKAEAESTSDS